MKKLLSILFVLIFVGAAQASVIGTFDFDGTINLSDPDDGEKTEVDRYSFMVSNNTDLTFVSTEFSILPPDGASFMTGDTTFRNNSDQPVVFNEEIFETFVVIPSTSEVGDVLAGDQTDDGSELSAAYTLPGDTPILEVGETRTFAVLNLPVDSGAPTFSVEDSQVMTADTESMQIVPEPSVLVLLSSGGLLLMLSRRRV